MAASGQLTDYLQKEADTVKMPYLVIAGVVLLLMLLFMASKLPEGAKVHEDKSAAISFKVLRIPQVRWAVIAQFFYVGAQIGVGSFFIRFSAYVMDLPEKQAAFWWGYIAMVGFMVGRFTGTFFMKYIRPEKLLGLYAAIDIGLLMIVSFVHGPVAVYALMAVPFFMSIMFPTIFALGIQGLGEETKIASSFIVMSIVGGAFIPVVMGRISDSTGGNIQLSYIAPMLCFAVVLFFALRQTNNPVIQGEKVVSSH
jgi:FHS family L-fucose permease-like MFS transporter